jgi:hypothetical protein
MRTNDVQYCTFREITAAVVTWNVGASKPQNFRTFGGDEEFFHHILRGEATPNIVVFGFQELVDLEDKRLTAS